MTVADPLELETEQLRCDRRGCPAVARVLTELRQPLHRVLHLAFCGHDYADLEPLLILRGWRIVADTRPRVAAREATRRAA